MASNVDRNHHREPLVKQVYITRYKQLKTTQYTVNYIKATWSHTVRWFVTITFYKINLITQKMNIRHNNLHICVACLRLIHKIRYCIPQPKWNTIQPTMWSHWSHTHSMKKPEYRHSCRPPGPFVTGFWISDRIRLGSIKNLTFPKFLFDIIYIILHVEILHGTVR